jgi:hypothetical protein
MRTCVALLHWYSFASAVIWITAGALHHHIRSAGSPLRGLPLDWLHKLVACQLRDE